MLRTRENKRADWRGACTVLCGSQPCVATLLLVFDQTIQELVNPLRRSIYPRHLRRVYDAVCREQCTVDGPARVEPLGVEIRELLVSSPSAAGPGCYPTWSWRQCDDAQVEDQIR